MLGVIHGLERKETRFRGLNVFCEDHNTTGYEEEGLSPRRTLSLRKKPTDFKKEHRMPVDRRGVRKNCSKVGLYLYKETSTRNAESIDSLAR